MYRKSIYQNMTKSIEKLEQEQSQGITLENYQNIINEKYTCGYCSHCQFMHGNFICTYHNLIMLSNEICEQFKQSYVDKNKWQKNKIKNTTIE